MFNRELPNFLCLLDFVMTRKTDEMNSAKWRSDDEYTVLIVTPEGNCPVERNR